MGVSRPVYNVRPINCESVRTRRRQILDRDFTHDARRIARPISHRGFAGEDHALFCGRTNNSCEIQTERDDRDVEANANESAMCHYCLESPLVCLPRGLLRARIARSCSGEYTLPAYMSQQLAENRESLGLDCETIFPLRKLSAGKRFCSKVRDREDALASTRAACAPRNVQRSSCVFDERSD